jgi:hypothetical protein
MHRDYNKISDSTAKLFNTHIFEFKNLNQYETNNDF